MTNLQTRIDPPQAVLEAAHAWLRPVQAALGDEFLAAYLTGSVLRAGFDARRSRVNLLIVARELPSTGLDSLASAVASAIGRGSAVLVRFEPLFVTRRQIDSSLDVFPIEWLDIQEHHLLLEGVDFFETIEVPRANLRLQCEQELRGKHLRLRQEYLASAEQPERLRETLSRVASGFHTLFRTLLRLENEVPPASTEHLIERIAAVHGLDATALMGAYRIRHAEQAIPAEQVRAHFRGFLAEVEALISAIDGLRVP